MPVPAHNWEKMPNDHVMWVCRTCKLAYEGQGTGYSMPAPFALPVCTGVSAVTEDANDLKFEIPASKFLEGSHPSEPQTRLHQRMQSGGPPIPANASPEDLKKIINEDRAQRAAEAFIHALKPLDPASRLAALDAVKDIICFECGGDQPTDSKQRCQCWNDE